MNLQQRKLQIIDQLIRTENESTIDKIEKVISKSGDFWDELSSVEKTGIDVGIKELEEGKRIPHSKVKKKYAKWL